jgi:predicted Zn finger-like uncharacterized protein
MSLQTTCSNCHSVFRISQQQLAAADGWAQCGVCAAPFDALAGMPDDEREQYLTPPEPEPESVPEVVAEAPAADPATPSSEPEPAPPVTPPVESVAEGALESISTEETLPGSSNLPGLDRRLAEEAAEAAGAPHSDLPSIIILDPDARVPEEIGPLPDIQEPSAQPYGYPVDELEDDDEEEGEPLAEEGTIPVSRPVPGEANFTISGARAQKVSGWVWIGLPVLTLLLLGQLAYFLRDSLAAHYPEVRPLLVSACTVVGCDMGLPQNVEQIKILGSDLQAEPGNGKRLTLALTLANQASYAQAWPMLQLTLTDTKDSPLARRVFAPSEYLNHAGMQDSGIPPLSETPLSLHLETRDVSASGFRVEVFY